MSAWMVSIIAVIVAGLLLYVLIKFRKRPDSPPAASFSGNHTLEIIWTIIPILVLAGISIPTLKAAFYLADVPSGPDVVNIKVVGHQWWWEFDYPDQKINTAYEMHIPKGKKIALTITSDDVIHSFWVPRLAGKLDAVPGRPNHMWLQADAAGTYSAQCAEFCGDSHANMRFRVVADEPAVYDAWVKTMSTKAVSEDALVKQGEKLFLERPCFSCHAIDGTKAQAHVGPNLTHVGSRPMLAGGMLENNQANLTKWLQNPPAVKPGSIMPNLGLKPDDIKALVAYLQSLK